jgi:hypothetical protein
LGASALERFSRPAVIRVRGAHEHRPQGCRNHNRKRPMKLLRTTAIALAVTAVAGCHKSPNEAVADNVEAKADNQADQIVDNATQAADNMQADASNQADAVRAEGDNTANAIRGKHSIGVVQ